MYYLIYYSFRLFYLFILWAGIAQSVQRVATGWTVRGSNPGGGEIFPTSPDWPWDPCSLLCTMGTGFFAGVNRPKRVVNHTPHVTPRLKKEQSFSSTPPLGLRGPFLGEIYLFHLEHSAAICVSRRILHLYKLMVCVAIVCYIET